MSKLNLKRQYVVEDKRGEPHGFGPGEADVPEWALEKLAARGVNTDGSNIETAEEIAAEMQNNVNKDGGQ
jgi:hypothetical protein